MKRVEAERHDVLVPYIDRFIDEVGALDQPSAQWTLAQLFGCLAEDMSEGQHQGALKIMKRNLEAYDDWIVLKSTLQTLSVWAEEDEVLKVWLIPHAQRLSHDPRKTVSGQARKALKALGA